MNPTNNSRKRKADSLTRISLGNAAGRGSQTGWTLCPLCGRHSKKQFALGRGIAMHLHSVHTPWNPGKVERKKRRRLNERRKRQQSTDPLSDQETETREEPWSPTGEEIQQWNARVLSIVEELGRNAQATQTGTNENSAAGLDRNGKEVKAYKESLPDFVQAAAQGNIDALKSMVDQATKNDTLNSLLNTKDRHQSLAEHWSAGGGHIECLRYLCELRQSIEQSSDSTAPPGTRKLRRRDGKTCLHYAARNGRMECVKYLVEEQRCDVDEESGDGTTPLHLACFGGHQDVVEYLQNNGADVVRSNEWGCTAAHWIAMTQNESENEVRKLCSFLKSHGLCFVARQKQGHTPLHKAAQRKNRHVIRWMLEPEDVGGAGLSQEENFLAGAADDGNHTPSDIWTSVGGESDFAGCMKQCGW